MDIEILKETYSERLAHTIIEAENPIICQLWTGGLEKSGGCSSHPNPKAWEPEANGLSPSPSLSLSSSPSLSPSPSPGLKAQEPVVQVSEGRRKWMAQLK